VGGGDACPTSDDRTVKHFDRIRRKLAKGGDIDGFDGDDDAMKKSMDSLETWEQEDWVKDITHRFNHEESDLVTYVSYKGGMGNQVA
jgi:hypothetical protein